MSDLNKNVILEKKEKYQITRQNYINMKKRIESDLKFYNFILTFGALYLIILTITNIYFDSILNDNILNYVSLTLSIILYTISLIIKPIEANNNRNNLKNGILKLNFLISEIEKLESEKASEIESEYDELMKEMINRKDIDYYTISKELIKKIETKNYKNEMKQAIENSFYEKIELIWNKYRYVITILLFIFFGIWIYSKNIGNLAIVYTSVIVILVSIAYYRENKKCKKIIKDSEIEKD